MNQLYYGSVQAVYYPNDPRNANGYQMEYSVLITTDRYAQVPLQNVLRADDEGGPDSFEDKILQVGNKVLVAVLKDFSQCFIVGAIRNTQKTYDSSMGLFSLRRFNMVDILFDQNGNWSVTSDSGPYAQVNTATVVLSDGDTGNITLDQVNKVLTVNAMDLTIVLQGDAKVTIQGDANLSVQGDANVDIQGDSNVDVGGDVNLSASTVKVDADDIQLAGQEGMVVTTATYPVDYLTGIPILGSLKVKAGS